MNPGKTALVTALVTATVSSRLSSRLRLSGHHENYLTILTAVKHLEVATSPRPLPAYIPRRPEWTLHIPPLARSLMPVYYLVYTNLKDRPTLVHPHTGMCDYSAE